MSPVRLSIIVPCYNEEKNIPLVLANFNRALAGREAMELLLVDNGSRDGTGKVMDAEIIRQKCNFARKVIVPQNRGYGFGILSGLKEARGEVLAWTHADLQTDPEDVLRAYHCYLEKAGGHDKILVKGHRQNRKPAEKLFSFGMQVFSSMMLGTWLEEINAQPKLFPRKLYENMRNPPQDFSLDLYLLYWAKKLGYKIVSIPVYFKERLYDEAKGGGSGFRPRWKLIQRTFRYVCDLSQKARKGGLN